MNYTEAVIDPDTRPFVEGEASILCRKIEPDTIHMQWLGPVDAPVPVTTEFLRLITPEGCHYNKGLERLPWRLEVDKSHPFIPDAVYLRRIDPK